MTTATKTALSIKSTAFKNNEFIPSKYTCEGADVNPDLEIEDLPSNTKSLALIVDDPDAPNGTFDHWVMWDIPPKSKIEEDSAPGIEGKNSKQENRYTGPCPPSGTHHYHFKIYALDTKLSFLPPSTNKKSLEKSMKQHIIASGELIGLYKI